MNVTRDQLDQAFSHVIHMLQGPLALGDRKLAIIGGFCVQHYLGECNRETEVFFWPFFSCIPFPHMHL